MENGVDWQTEIINWVVGVGEVVSGRGIRSKNHNLMAKGAEVVTDFIDDF